MYSLRLRTITEEYNGIPWSYIMITGLYAVLFVIVPLVCMVLLHTLIFKIIFALTAIIFTCIWYLKLRSPAKLDTTRKWISYRYKLYRGLTVVPKHIVPMQFLRGIVPIDNIHPAGLIEFTNKRYGFMYRLFVPRRSGEDLGTFISLVTKNVVDRLYDGHVMKVFEMQRYSSDMSVRNQILMAMNDSSKSQAQREHLESLYRQITENSEVPMDRYIYAAIFLGRFGSVQEAMAERNNLAPSLEDGFGLGGIQYEMLVYPETISKVLRSCIK